MEKEQYRRGTFARIYLKSHRKVILAFILFCAVFACVFALYHLPMEAVAYPILICGVLGSLLLAYDFFSASYQWKQLWKLKEALLEMPEALPDCASWEGQAYRDLLGRLFKEVRRREDEMGARYQEMVEYYTIWVHQVKTPIASIRLNLQKEDSRLSRTVLEDVLRIEQYVEMVLAYLRLDSASTDYVIASCDLDEMVRQAVKKFAGWFIHRKIALEFTPTSKQVVTDEKWMVFVLEQVLSNALKYTEQGKVSIYLEEPSTLCIQDTGIGIAPQDLPRIFEKGYTGYNGRSDKRASGIGLYLCKRICKNLGMEISAQSEPDQGTTIRIQMEQTKLEVE